MTDPVWYGQFNLCWRQDCFGKPNQALYLGRICIGHLMLNNTQAIHAEKPWRMWLMTDEDGDEIGYRATQQEAMDALVDAALNALMERTP